MEKNKKIESIEFISRDDKPYVKFVINTGEKSETFERPIYNEKGEPDPEVINLLIIAKNIDEKSKNQDNNINEEEIKEENLELSDNLEEVEAIDKETEEIIEESEIEEDYSDDEPVIIPAQTAFLEAGKQDEDINNETSLIPIVRGDLVKYNEPEQDVVVDKEGFFKKNGRLIAVGLAGILLGACLTKGCSCAKQHKKQNVTDVKKDNVVTDVSVENMEVEKIKYITKEQYETGVKQFCASLNSEYGFNYQPSQVTSFYYVANMENISEDLFKELINEGYIPDTVAKLFANVFEVTGSIRTQNLQTGTSKIDYSKLFVDQDAVKISENWETKFNNLKVDNKESAQVVVNELHDFIIVNSESEYNTLPTGTREIFNWTIAESVYTKASFAGVDAEQSLKEEIADMTTAIRLYDNTFNCLVVEEAEKTLTK